MQAFIFSWNKYKTWCQTCFLYSNPWLPNLLHGFGRIYLIHFTKRRGFSNLTEHSPCWTQPSRRPNNNTVPHIPWKHPPFNSPPLQGSITTPYTCVWSTWVFWHNDSPLDNSIKAEWGWFPCQVSTKLNGSVQNFFHCLCCVTQRTFRQSSIFMW